MTGKIIRARPKFLNPDQLHSFQNNSSSAVTPEGLFFNKGRSALMFLLLQLKNKWGRTPVIAMQDFNCHVVMEAALQSKCHVVLFDIKLTDFSIDLEHLKQWKPAVDVLLLTHYQGIPNFQYPEIAAYCKKNNILLVDDVSQTENSLVKGTRVGDLADVFLRSYAFDKPFSCYEGGSLHFHNPELYDLCRTAYDKLKRQSHAKTWRDLEKLNYLMRVSAAENYEQGVDIPMVLNLCFRFLNASLVEKLMRNRQVRRNLYELLKRVQSEKINIRKLRKEKAGVVQRQMENFYCKEKNEPMIENLALHYHLEPVRNQDAVICWNRYAILDKEKQLTQYLNSRNIEAGNFNWPHPLHRLYKDSLHINRITEYPNSVIAAENILNIPLWCNLENMI